MLINKNITIKFYNVINLNNPNGCKPNKVNTHFYCQSPIIENKSNNTNYLEAYSVKLNLSMICLNLIVNILFT